MNSTVSLQALLKSQRNIDRANRQPKTALGWLRQEARFDVNRKAALRILRQEHFPDLSILDLATLSRADAHAMQAEFWSRDEAADAYYAEVMSEWGRR